VTETHALYLSSSSLILIFGFFSDCKTFMEMFQEVAESQESKEENEDATVAADALEKLSVEGKKTEENAGEEAPAATKNEETKIDTDKKGEKPAPST
jgi:Ran-binding protein 1